MHALRHGIAVLLIVAIPAAILYWFMIHPFIRFWRRLGTRLSYTVICSILALFMASLYLLSGPLLATEWPFTPWLAIPGLLLLAVSVWLKIRLRKELSVRVLIGIPELANEQPGRLLSSGLFAHVRHPRYVQMTFALAGFALIVNYPATYGALLVWLAGIRVVAILEERELCERFGEPYREYCRDVPRFIPRLKKNRPTDARP